MAYEKECDFILSVLEMDANKNSHPIATFIPALSNEKFKLTYLQIMAVFVILHDKGHIQISEPAQIIVENGETLAIGLIAITRSGTAFINSTSYVKEKEKQDSLRIMAETNLQINKNVLTANRWIAIATVVAALYYIQQMVVSAFQSHLYVPVSLIVLLLLSGAIIGIAIYKLISHLLKRKE